MRALVVALVMAALTSAMADPLGVEGAAKFLIAYGRSHLLCRIPTTPGFAAVRAAIESVDPVAYRAGAAQGVRFVDDQAEKIGEPAMCELARRFDPEQSAQIERMRQTLAN